MILASSDAHDPRLSLGMRLGDGDRYEIREAVGRGGMAEVYRAIDRRLNGRVVAVKTLSASVAEHPHAKRLLALFIEEAQALSRVKDDNVVDVLDSGTGPDGAPFMVMEFLSGRDLAGLLKAEKRLSVTRTADIMMAVCAGVDACHLAGIIHRDLKPGNIFLAQTARGETPKVLDFGVAKIPVSRDQANTDLVVGTPSYMSPEQALGRPADERSDQYSIGALTYRCLVGRPPRALLAKVRDLRPDLPEGIEAVLLRAMDPIPDGRFASVHDLGHALLPFASPAVRLKWRAFYARRRTGAPSAPPAAANAKDQVDVTQSGATTVAPYDFGIHERTTNTSGAPEPTAPGQPDARAKAADDGPETVLEEPVAPMRNVVIASIANASNDPVESTGHSKIPGPRSANKTGGRRAVALALVAASVLMAKVAVVRFAGQSSTRRLTTPMQNPSLRLETVGQEASPPLLHAEIPSPHSPSTEVSPQISDSSKLIEREPSNGTPSTDPAPATTGAADPIVAAPRRRSHRLPRAELGVAKRTAASRNPDARSRIEAGTVEYPAVGRGSDSKYPAVE